MEIDELATRLKAHEVKDDVREEKLTERLDKEETKMGASEAINFFSAPDAGGGAGAMVPALMAATMGNRGDNFGGGLGAGVIGGVLGGLLFGGNGFNNRRDGGDCGRDSACLNGTDGMALMGAIGNVKDTVGMSTMNITTQLAEGFSTQNINTLQQSIMLGNIASSNQLMTHQAINLVNQNVSDQGCRTREAVFTDGAATRGLIVQLNNDNLNRLLTVADLDRRDERTHARQREVEVTVTQTVNQNQLQLQAQQQQQQIASTLGFLCNQLAAVHQEARATNANIIAGNTGAVTTGAQTSTASPTNVSA